MIIFVMIICILSFESELYESSTDHILSNPKDFVIVIDLNSCPHLFAVC